MTRPTTITGLSGSDFAAYYWLKSELIDFCRENKLPTSGSKEVLTRRIQHFLKTGEVVKMKTTSSTSGHAKMPITFTGKSIIGPGWRCSQELRAFFESEIGPAFHFNQFLRDFIKRDGIGQTLNAAIEGWQRAQEIPNSAKEIAPQFEYNRHFRDYFAQNPDATRKDAIRAWHQKKAQRTVTTKG